SVRITADLREHAELLRRRRSAERKAQRERRRRRPPGERSHGDSPVATLPTANRAMGARHVRTGKRPTQQGRSNWAGERERETREAGNIVPTGKRRKIERARPRTRNPFDAMP